MTDEPAKNLPTVHEALVAVMAEVEVIGKDDRNKDQGFRYRGIDATVNAVGPAFRNAGIFCIPTALSFTDERYETKKGANMRGVTVHVRFRFYGPAGDYVEATTYGEAADAGDKAVSKAHSVAYRTALLQTLCIPTGEEDPDASSHERAVERRQEGPPPTPVPTSWAQLEEMVRKCDNPEEAWLLFQAFLRAAMYHLFGKTDPAELEQSQRDTLWQKAAGATVWMVENVQTEGPDFHFYDEALQRRAWARVLDGHALAIPDYRPPEPPLDPKAEAEAEALAAEVFSEPGDEAPATSEELAADDTAPSIPQD